MPESRRGMWGTDGVVVLGRSRLRSSRDTDAAFSSIYDERINAFCSEMFLRLHLNLRRQACNSAPAVSVVVVFERKCHAV
eukprot:3714357-Alexandrium_andersonii.AAC.1